MPKGILGWSIVATILSLCPLGFWGIVKAVKSRKLWFKGEYELAEASAKTADVISLISIGIGFITIIVVLSLVGIVTDSSVMIIAMIILTMFGFIGILEGKQRTCGLTGGFILGMIPIIGWIMVSVFPWKGQIDDDWLSNVERNDARLKTNRELDEFLVFSLFTFGIYGVFVMSHLSKEINVIASKHDNRHTMHFCLMILLNIITLGIYSLIWYSNFSSRIGKELTTRNISYEFSARTFWIYNILWSGVCALLNGVFLFLVFFGSGFVGVYVLFLIIIGLGAIYGPCKYIEKLLDAMNLLCKDFNNRD